MANEIVLRTKDHPEANGRQAKSGEKGWTLRFPLETGTSLVVLIGETSFNKFREFLGQYTLDVMQEAEEEAVAALEVLTWIQVVKGREWRSGKWEIGKTFGKFFAKDPTGAVIGPMDSLPEIISRVEERRASLAGMQRIPNGW